MANITFGGLASGMDTGAIVSELMNLERQPLERMEREKSYLNNRLDAFKKFDTKLDELKSFFEDFDTSQDVRSFTATAASEDFFTISAGSSAVGGSFQVEVQNLAQVQKDVSVGYASKTSADFTAGTITINGTDITVEASDSLSDIAEKINTANTGDSATGISASIINDGTANGYRIVLTGKDADTTFTASTTGVSSGGTALSFANTQTAELASIVVDGITITSKNNTITDAIPGATLSLLKENDPGINTTVAVETDNDGIKEKLNEFVSKYNNVLSYIDEQKDADWGRDNGLQGVRRKLQNLLVTNIGGTGNLNYLVDIGIETDQYTGKISIDESKLDDLIQSDLESLESLFLGEDGVDGISTLFKTYLEGATDHSNGILAAKEKSTDMGVRNLDNNIQRMEMRLEKREELLNAQFAAMEQLVSGMNSTASYLAQQMTMLAGITQELKMVNAYSNNYLENQIKSASPEQLLIMFYDGAIRFVSQAIQAIEEKNIEKRNHSCNKACAIISELNATLDHNIGGKVAADLNLLYDYMIRELHSANSSSNVEKARHIEKMLCDLRDTWKKAVDINKQSHQPRTPEKQYRPFSAAM